MKESRKDILDPKNLGLSGGIIWGMSLFLLTLIALSTGYATDFLEMISASYPGYDISWLGSFVGLFWGFIEGFAILYLLGVFYNWINRKRNRDNNKDKKDQENQEKDQG